MMKIRSSRLRWTSLALLLAVTGVTFPLRGQAPTPATVDSLAKRLEAAEAAIELLRQQMATESEAAVRTRSRMKLEFNGRVLLNAYSNSSRANNAEAAYISVLSTAQGGGGFAMSLRQTTLGMAFTATDVLGGTFIGDLDADLFAGGSSNSNARVAPEFRLRTARAILDWDRGQLLVGQEQPLIANVNPVSLAAIGVPAFTATGNLWLWLPQVRGTVQSSGKVRVALQGAVLSPHAGGDVSNVGDVFYDAAETTRKPMLEGRLRLSWGSEESAGEFGVGFHKGWLKDTLNGEVSSSAVAASFVVPLGRYLEVRGEAFDGEGLQGLGGGGIGQGRDPATGAAVETKGGWAQLNVRATPRLMLGVGGGMDDPDEAGTTIARLKNETVGVHAQWRPAGPLVLGVEGRRIWTRYAAGLAKNDHLNFAMGFEF